MMATVPNWWQQGAMQINPLDQTWSGAGEQSSRFGMNNYNQILQQLLGDKWVGGAPDDSSQGGFNAQDVQDFLSQNGYQLMMNQGVGVDGGADKYQNMHWMQDASGNMIGDPTFNRDDPNGVLKALAVAAGGYFGGGALANAYGGAAAGGAAAEGGLGTMGTIGAGSGQYAALPSVLESGVSLGSVPAVSGTVAGAGGLGGITAGQVAGGASAAAGLGGGGGDVGDYSNEGRNYPTPGSTQGPGGSPINASMTGTNWLDSLAGLVGSNGMIPWQNVLGAYMGYKSSQDQQQTSSRDPWSGAQPMLKGLLDQGQSLQKQYAEQPFSQQQQTAYNNLGGLLNAANASAPGLLSGMTANSSGANNYDRANPRKALQGGGASLAGFNPGLLQFFGGK